MSNEEWKTRQVWYAGRFHAKGNKIYHQFVDAETEALHMFAKAPTWATIGGLYEVEFLGTRARIEGGTLVEDHDLHPDHKEWRLNDQAQAMEKQHQDALKRMQSHNSDIGKLTLDEILGLMLKQPRHVRNGTRLIVMDYLR
jgi:hypothetical protein